MSGASCPRLLIAAPASGSGKTTVTLGLLGCLLERGLAPAAFKCGPDYIDPLFHREVLGLNGGNLDLFFTPPDAVRGLLARHASPDLSVIEGVMGYYDGVALGDRASSWRLAAETGTPALLVVPARGASVSLAAIIAGFASFRKPAMIAGAILNRCPARLYAKLAPMLERECGVRLFGHLDDLPKAALHSRHLGLVTPEDLPGVRASLTALSRAVADTMDVDGLLALARTAPPLAPPPPRPEPPPGPPVRIGVARDPAFCFYYRENLELLADCGAELVFFSPLADPAPPPGLGGLYLGGGYPELHAARLAENRAMRRGIAHLVAAGLPTVAECGGYLYLLDALHDREGTGQPMAGAIPGTGRPAGALRRFGYINVTAERDTLLLRRGETVPAHEFHYWESDAPGDACQAARPAGGESWPCCHGAPALHAGFPHWYFPAHPAMAERFVRAAQQWSTP